MIAAVWRAEMKPRMRAELRIITAAVLMNAQIALGERALAQSNGGNVDPLPVIAAQDKTAQPGGRASAGPPRAAQISPNSGAGVTPISDGPILLRAQVVDSRSHQLAGVDVYVTILYPRPFEDAEEVVDHAVSDARGEICVQVARERIAGRLSAAVIWAYQPGRTLVRASSTFRGLASQPMIRLTLEEPIERTVAVLGPDGKPNEGIRVYPRTLRAGNSRFAITLPEPLRQRLPVTSNAKGLVTLAYLGRNVEPLTMEVVGPGLAAHTLTLSDAPHKSSLKIGRTGRLVGVVRDESDQPLPNVPIVVLNRSSGALPAGIFDPNTRAEAITFEPKLLTSGAQGAFQTPPTLLSGSTYRVWIRHDGFAPFVSDWLTLSGDRTTVPSVRLRRLRALAGQVCDRQGQAVAGARVFVPSGPAALTDTLGRFDLQGVLPDRTVLVVERSGFRLHGWPVEPATLAHDLRLTLLRSTEAAERDMTPLAEPIPPDEAKALASRVLEPYFLDGPKGGDLNARRAAIEALSLFDLDRAVGLVKSGFLGQERAAVLLRGELARRLAEKNQTDAEALVEPISDPALLAQSLLAVAKGLPGTAVEQKRRLVEKAASLVHSMPDSPGKLPQVASVAEAWLDLGEAERARPDLLNGLKLLGTSAYSPRNSAFVIQLARLDPKLAIPQIQKAPQPRTLP